MSPKGVTGAELGEVLERLDLSVPELARLTGYSESAVYRIRRGERQGSRKFRKALEEALAKATHSQPAGMALPSSEAGSTSLRRAREIALRAIELLFECAVAGSGYAETELRRYADELHERAVHAVQSQPTKKGGKP